MHRGVLAGGVLAFLAAGVALAAQVPADEPEAAVIPELVKQGYLVRTRADAPVTTPTIGDITQRDAALAGGAQIVSTDYPVPGGASRWGSDYVAQLPGGVPARCKPVRVTRACTAKALTERAGSKKR